MKPNSIAFCVAITPIIFVIATTIILIACSPEPAPNPAPSIKDQADLLVKILEIDRILKERQARIDVLEKEKTTINTRLTRCKMDLKLHDLCPNSERFFKKCADWNNKVRCMCGNYCEHMTNDQPCSMEMSEYYRQINMFDWRLK